MTQTGHMSFDYPNSECDVRESERPRLKRFRERFSVWRDWLSKDEHSIWGQIHGMLWNDMVFRTVNECRRLAHKNPSPHVAFNGAVVSFIDEGYAAKQLLAIRRLTETNGRGDAITLPRLLDDMKANAELFTREMYVCHDGLPFDPRPAQERFFQEVSAAYSVSVPGRSAAAKHSATRSSIQAQSISSASRTSSCFISII